MAAVLPLLLVLGGGTVLGASAALAKGATVVQVEGMGPFVRYDVKPGSM
jgi:hypothetical protein